MVLHCNYRTKASEGNDSCLEAFIPVAAMQMNDEEVKHIY
jgi:hypothetical protein